MSPRVALPEFGEKEVFGELKGDGCCAFLRVPFKGKKRKPQQGANMDRGLFCSKLRHRKFAYQGPSD